MAQIAAEAPSANTTIEDRRRHPQTPKPGGRRIRDEPTLRQPFEAVLVSISNQVCALQDSRGLTLAQVAGSDLSEHCVLDVQKARGDPKVSTLVRLAARYDYEVVVSFRPKRLTRPTAL